MNKEDMREKVEDGWQSCEFVMTDTGKYWIVQWLGVDPDPGFPYYVHSDLGLCPKAQFKINGIPLMQIDISLISKS